MIETSILIVEYKTPELLARCIASLKELTTGSYEVLVHDNSPPRPNLGFAKANNYLISRSKGKYIVLLNPDTVVTPRWLDFLIATAQSDPRIGVVQPKLLLPNGMIDSTGHGWTKWGTPFDRGAGEFDKGQFDGATELSSCCFGCALIKREVFEKVGLLDEKLFLFLEDVEFCLRAKKAGWRVVYCPKSIVYHSRHGSGAAEGRFNIPYIILKTRGPRMYFKILIFLILGIATGVKNSDIGYVKKKIKQTWDSILIQPHSGPSTLQPVRDR